MPLTKQYLRYVPSGVFNIIASPGCNSVWTSLKNVDGRFIATGACEDIIIWDVQLGEKAEVLTGDKSEVTILCASPAKRYIAAGYRDGSVRTYDLSSGDNITVFSGHKSAVSCLAYDEQGHRLASGSKDTHIVVWDVVAETGVSRLSSHTGPVTNVTFLPNQNVLVSSSKDTSIKFWDLVTNYCFKTLLGHRTEVWDFVVIRNGEFLVTGSGDSELRVWSVVPNENYTNNDSGTVRVEEDDEVESDGLSILKTKKLGSILRAGTGRVSAMTFEDTRNLIGVHGAADTLELFQFVSLIDAIRRLRKRRKKEKKKEGTEGDPNEELGEPALQDFVKRLPVIKTKGKIKSCDLIIGRGSELRVLLALNNNSVEVFGMNIDGKERVPNCLKRIVQQGHHSEIRALAFSSDSLAMASGSADSIKLWNRSSLACLRTTQCGYVLSLIFVTGDRHVIAGMKDGKILIVDVSVGDILEEIPGHTTEVWSLCLLPNQRGCVSGGGDSTVKMWDFELIEDKQSRTTAKVLSLLHKKTLTLEEAVLCVRVSPDCKFIAVALLDMTIKIFFFDTLKFFLSLYGHKLPVLTMDISYDSRFLVSGSADRNVKIWGLDFGDCHKSLFAHEGSITCVQFVPQTHYFFTCGKDGKIKQWDGDTFDKIITLQGHFGEAHTLAISANGDHLVSAGSDRVLRLVSKTEEPLVLEDEAEEERAREDESELLTGPETIVRGQGDLNLPSRKTIGSELGAEQLLECLDVCKQYMAETEAYEAGGRKGQPPTRPPIMLAYNALDCDSYLVGVIKKIRASDLEEALLLLPFSSACDLLRRFPALLKKEGEVELVTRTLMFLLKVHHGPIVSSRELLSVLSSVQELSLRRVTDLRDMVGYNLHGLQYLQRDIEQKEGIQLFRDATIARKQTAKKKKRKEGALKRAILAL